MYFSAKVDEQKCVGCKICMATCPDPNVIGFIKERKKASVNPKRCKGCGLCITVCPKSALSMQLLRHEAFDDSAMACPKSALGARSTDS